MFLITFFIIKLFLDIHQKKNFVFRYKYLYVNKYANDGTQTPTTQNNNKIDCK